LGEASESEANGAVVRNAYEKFAKMVIDNEATIITFNYDLLIEKLLEGTFKWRRYDGYGAHIPLAHKAMPTSPHTFLYPSINEDTDTKWSPVTLLKLHGSINWGRAIIADDKSDLIFQIPISGGASMADFAVRTEFGPPFTQYFEPVIVPPVLDKSSWLRNPTFKVLWNMAMEAVEAAEQITFVGYSLRATDFMAEFLFRQAVNMRSVERRIIVIDPKASELEGRFRDVFGSTPAPALEMTFTDCDFVSYASSL
jgi:hypothetical protein